jgi:hypothetical protein
MSTMTTTPLYQADCLSRGQALLLIATLSFASWVAVIGVIYFGMVSYLG